MANLSKLIADAAAKKEAVDALIANDAVDDFGEQDLFRDEELQAEWDDLATAVVRQAAIEFAPPMILLPW